MRPLPPVRRGDLVPATHSDMRLKQLSLAGQRNAVLWRSQGHPDSEHRTRFGSLRAEGNSVALRPPGRNVRQTGELVKRPKRALPGSSQASGVSSAGRDAFRLRKNQGVGRGINGFPDRSVMLQTQAPATVPQEKHRLLLPPKCLVEECTESPTFLLFFGDSPIVGFAVSIRRSRYKVNRHIDVAQPISAAQVAAEYDRLFDAGQEVRILIQRCDALQEIIEQALSRPSEKRFGCA